MQATQSTKAAAYARTGVPNTHLGRRASVSARQQLQQRPALKGLARAATARRARPQTQVLRRVCTLFDRLTRVRVDSRYIVDAWHFVRAAWRATSRSL